MSSSTVTYTPVYTDSKPWRFQWVFDDEQEAPDAAPQSLGQAPSSPDYVNLNNSTSNVLIPLDSWTSGLLVYKEPLSNKEKKSSMETFVLNDKADYYSGIKSITVNGKNAYDLREKFLDDPHNNAFSGTNRNDAVEHIEYYLKIIDPIRLPNVDHDRLRIVVFPIALAGGAQRWFDRTKESITCWVDLTAIFFRKYYPSSRIKGNNTTVIKWDPANPRFKGCDEIELLKVDPDLLTKDIMGFKTYEDYKDDWIYEWNENVPWVCDKPGNLPGACNIRNSLHYQDLEWYKALEDSKLKDKALRNKAIMEGLISDDESSNDWRSHEITYHDHDEIKYENETHDERQKLCEAHELTVCNIRKFEMIEYSFGHDEEYVAVKEYKYDDLARTILSSGYVADFDSEEDPEEDLADYPVDGGEVDDDESSDDDDDNDDDDEEQEAFEDDDEKEEEHPALADFYVVPVDDPIPSAEDTQAFKTNESAPTPIPSPRRRMARIPTYAEAPLGYRAAEIRLRAASPSTHHLSEIPLPPLLLLSTSHRDDTPKADMPLRKRARFTALASGFEVGESSAAAAVRQPVLDVATVDATLGRLVSGEVSYGIKETHDARIGSLETLITTLVAQTSSLQTKLTTALGRIQTLEAREPARTDVPEDAGSIVYLAKMPQKKRTATTTTTTPMTDAQIKALISQGVVDALAEIKANRTSRNGDENHDSGTGSRRTKRATRECTTSSNSNPLISRFATCTLLGSALTWWNSHVKAVGHNAAYGMTWKSLMKMLNKKYCPRDEIKKLKNEIWNLKVKGTDVASYTQRFKELALMCERMFPKESKQVEKYGGGIPDMIQ
nr:reverse transcriptase domain-containing protein [Tanacetum cinerariifolium]